MKKQLSIFALTLAASASISFAANASDKPAEPAAAKETETIIIRYVDPYKVLAGLDQWKDKTDIIQKEIDTRAKNIENMKRSGQTKQEQMQNMRGTASDNALEKIQKEIMQLSNEIRIEEEALQNFAQNAMQKAQMEILQSIEEANAVIAKERGIDLVQAGPVLFASAKIDITQDVVALMNEQYTRKKLAKAPAPKETTKLAKTDDKTVKA